MAADVRTRTAIDDVFDDNFSDLDVDPFTDKPSATGARDDKAVLSPRSSLKRRADADRDDDNFGLGLDQEVKIVKKRKPIAKLDEARLLSEPGIPVLRSLIREKRIGRKLKLKGKGHEFSDTARLLNYFQLWLDNLYPRAKFADALQLVEKAGHTKRMQLMRNEWINESKPGYHQRGSPGIDTEIRPDEMPDLFAANTGKASDSNDRGDQDKGKGRSIFGNGLDDDSMFIPDGDHDPVHDHNDDPDEDDLDALLAMQGDSTTASQPPLLPPEESEGEDDLDALLAEQDARQHTGGNERQIAISQRGKPPNQEDVDDDDDDDDLEALLAEQDVRAEKALADQDDNEIDALSPTTARARAEAQRNNATDPHSAEVSNDDHRTEMEDPLLPTTLEATTVVAEGEDSQLRGLEENMMSSSPIPNA